MNFDQFEYYKTKYFLFVINPAFKFEADRIIHTINNRQPEIYKLFKQDISMARYYKYIIDVLSNDSHDYGKTSNDTIVCRVKSLDSLSFPFVHEEAHAMAFNTMGNIPKFWSEGIAHWVEKRYFEPQWPVVQGGRKVDEVALNKAYMFFKKKNRIDVMDNFDIVYYTDLLRNFEVTYEAAGILIDFLISCYGYDYLKRLIQSASVGCSWRLCEKDNIISGVLLYIKHLYKKYGYDNKHLVKLRYIMMR
jgi:hypothetical protein